MSDTGPGLEPGQAVRVFERFYRTDPARARGAGGAGLGLSLVQALVAAHGGTVEVRTAPGEGATFRVTLPLHPELVPSPPRALTTPPTSPARPTAASLLTGRHGRALTAS